MAHHKALTDSREDQLCLAAIQYLIRNHFPDICKRVLVEGRGPWALNIYIALCYKFD